MFTISCIPITKAAHRGVLTYFSTKDIEPGMLVEVLYNRRKVFALVLGVEPLAASKSEIKNLSFRIKKIERIVGHSPLHSALMASVAEYCSEYHIPVNTTIETCTPRGFLATYAEQMYEEGATAKPAEHRSPEQHNEFWLDENSRALARLLEPKTEGVLDEFFDRGQSVVVVAPSAAAAKKLAALVRSDDAHEVVALHGHLTPKQQEKAFARLLDSRGEPVLVIMTPYFLACMPQNVGACIVAQVSSYAHISMQKPTINFVALVRGFCRSAGVECIMCDTVVPLGLKHKLDRKKWPATIVRVEPRTQDKLVSYEHTPGELLGDWFYGHVQALLQENTNAKIGIFVPRLGYASTVSCRDCGSIVRCKECGAPASLFRHDESAYRCRRCHTTFPVTDTCVTCDGNRLDMLGMNLERVVEGLGERFPDLQIHPVTHKELSKKSFLAKIEKNEDAICLVGTQALLGLDTHFDVLLVPSSAHLTSLPGYDGYEQAIRLVMQMKSSSNSLVVFAKKDEAELVVPLTDIAPATLLQEELDLRKELGLPPFATHIHFILPNTSRRKLEVILKAFPKEEIKKWRLASSEVNYFGNHAGSVLASTFDGEKIPDELWAVVRRIDRGAYAIVR